MNGKSKKTDGFTLMGVLIMMTVMGISMLGASNYWSTILKREKEAELLFRGDQIKQAIQSYYNQTPTGNLKKYPRSVNDLLKDPRFLTVKRHLRKQYKDPMTQDGNWAFILSVDGGIKGVHSQSNRIPLRSNFFQSDYQPFSQAKTYQDWKFLFDPAQKGNN